MFELVFCVGTVLGFDDGIDVTSLDVPCGAVLILKLPSG